MTSANRKVRSDIKHPRCPSCGGARHQHTSKLPEDFRCWWTQFSREVHNLPEGRMLPLRKNLVIEWANWVEGNAKPRPERNQQSGPDIPPNPDERVRFFE